MILEVAELNMLRFSLGVRRLDRISNEHIIGTIQGQSERGQSEIVWTCAEEYGCNK